MVFKKVHDTRANRGLVVLTRGLGLTEDFPLQATKIERFAQSIRIGANIVADHVCKVVHCANPSTDFVRWTRRR